MKEKDIQTRRGRINGANQRSGGRWLVLDCIFNFWAHQRAYINITVETEFVRLIIAPSRPLGREEIELFIIGPNFNIRLRLFLRLGGATEGHVNPNEM